MTTTRINFALKVITYNYLVAIRSDELGEFVELWPTNTLNIIPFELLDHFCVEILGDTCHPANPEDIITAISAKASQNQVCPGININELAFITFSVESLVFGI